MEHNHLPLHVGTFVQLKRHCLFNPEGTVGVVYEVYERTWRAKEDHERFGISVIFPNGRHDGFSASERQLLLTVIGESTNPAVRNYQFTHVTQLMRDYDKGLFTRAFQEGLLVKVGAH